MSAWEGGGAFDVELLDTKPGFCLFKATGQSAHSIFAYESGGHRWQRVSPTEKRGRVQTSTVTVAAMLEPAESSLHIRDQDLTIQTTKGSGAGGQHRNTTETAIQITHRPSGIQVRCESERSQSQNRRIALSLLRAKLLEQQATASTTARNVDRRNQIGTGQRGDKVRTVRVQDGIVTDERTKRKTTFKRYSEGDFGGLTP